MPWVLLLLASVLEIGWAVGLKFTHGFTMLIPSVLVAIGIVSTLVLLLIVVRHIPIGTAYAVFTGIGAGGTGVLGIYLFDEPAGLMRILSLMVIICGVTGLKVSSEPATPTDSEMPPQPRIGGRKGKGGIASWLGWC